MQIIHKAVSNLDYVKNIEGPVRDIVVESYIQGFVSAHCREHHVRRQNFSADLCLQISLLGLRRSHLWWRS